MSTIVTRAGKGSALSFAEGDANFTNLNTDKIESVQQDTAPSLGGNLDVNGFGIVNTTGSGDIALNSDTVKLGLGQDPEGVVITTQGALDLVLDTNDGIDTGEIRIETGASGNIVLTPTGKIVLGGNLITNGNQIRAEGDDSLVFVTTGTGGLIMATQVGANVSLTANGTQIERLLYNEKIHDLGTTSGTIAPNIFNGNVQSITLNGNLTLNEFTNGFAGQSLTLIINTNGTGRTLTSSWLFAGGEKTLSTTNTTDIISVFYDGEYYYASLSKGFA